MEIIFIAILGLITLALAPVVPLKLRFATALTASVLQLYIFPVGDFYISVAFAASLFLWPETIKEARRLFRKKIFVIATGVFAAHIVSLLWSPDSRMGIRTIVYILPFFFTVCSAYSLANKNEKFLYKILSITCLIMTIEAALVIVFRLSPLIETSYLTSNISGLFSGPNVIFNLLSGTEANNVFDPDKSGGLLVNGNTAATYLGMGGFTAFLTFKARKSKSSLIVAALLWTSVFFTGSKSGVMLAITLPITALLFNHYLKYSNQSKAILSKIVWLMVPLALFGAVQIAEVYADKYAFASDSFDTASIRFKIWHYATQAFFNSPILGQGFGGWQIGYAKYAASIGIPTSFPPHNTLIYLWSQSGIIAAICGMAFMYYVLKLAYQLTESTNQDSKNLGMILMLVAGWLFIHGMGENIGLFGEPHQQPLFATLLGLACASRLRNKNTSGTTLVLSKPEGNKQ